MADKADLSEVKRALLEKRLRGELRIPISTTASPVERAQEAIEQPTSKAARVSIVPIQPNGSKRPFFYLHPHWYGGATYIFTIAEALGNDQPLYMLDPYRYDGEKSPPSFETVAKAYIEVIRSVQPKGPYLLGGFCGGGLIAYEIARQLSAQGQTVDLLILIEAEDGPTLHLMLPRRWMGRAFRLAGRIFRRNAEQQLNWWVRVRHVYIMARYPSQRDEKTFWQCFRPFPPDDILRQEPIGLFVWAISQYIPTRYHGKLTYFWTEDSARKRLRWWDRIQEADEIERFVIAGTNQSCRNQDAGDMARRLKERIEAAQAAALAPVTSHAAS